MLGKNEKKSLNILLIGNSHTYFNDMPLMVQRRAEADGYDCRVVMIAHGGWYLSQHVEEPDVRINILFGGYDNVILHVVRTADKPVWNSKGELVPQCELNYPSDKDYLSGLFAAAQQMDSAVGRIGCAEQLLHEPGLLTEGWRKTLLYKRLDIL